MYEIMRYWDDDHAERVVEEHAFAALRSHPTWVVSRSLKSVNPNATIIAADLVACFMTLGGS